MRDAWRGPAVELVVEPTARHTAENAARTLPLLLERDVGRRRRRLRAAAPRPHAPALRPPLPRRGRRGRVPRRATRAERSARSRGSSRRCRSCRLQLRAARAELARRLDDERTPSSSSPPGTRRRTCRRCSTGCASGCRTADVLVVDDGSTDRTAEVAREHGAEVLSLGSNQGLRIGIAAGYRWALEHGYAFCGRVDADGQHPADGARAAARARAARTSATSRSAPASSPGTATRRTATGRARRGASARDCCDARSASCCGGRSATRRAASTP